MRAYHRYFLNNILCLKKGERVHTSEPFTVRASATLNRGSTNENVDQFQRFTLSSAIVNMLEDGCKIVNYTDLGVRQRDTHI